MNLKAQRDCGARPPNCHVYISVFLYRRTCLKYAVLFMRLFAAVCEILLQIFSQRDIFVSISAGVSNHHRDEDKITFLQNSSKRIHLHLLNDSKSYAYVRLIRFIRLVSTNFFYLYIDIYIRNPKFSLQCGKIGISWDTFSSIKS